MARSYPPLVSQDLPVYKKVTCVIVKIYDICILYGYSNTICMNICICICSNVNTYTGTISYHDSTNIKLLAAMKPCDGLALGRAMPDHGVLPAWLVTSLGKRVVSVM